jgi:hypothetical protein
MHQIGRAIERSALPGIEQPKMDIFIQMVNLIYHAVCTRYRAPYHGWVYSESCNLQTVSVPQGPATVTVRQEAQTARRSILSTIRTSILLHSTLSIVPGSPPEWLPSGLLCKQAHLHVGVVASMVPCNGIHNLRYHRRRFLHLPVLSIHP